MAHSRSSSRLSPRKQVPTLGHVRDWGDRLPRLSPRRRSVYPSKFSKSVTPVTFGGRLGEPCPYIGTDCTKALEI